MVNDLKSKLEAADAELVSEKIKGFIHLQLACI